MSDVEDRIVGCLLGGAIGDAMGAGIEFMSLDEIRGRFGPAGVTGYASKYGRKGAITDDTQMTLFTAEGLIRASIRGRSKGVCHTASVVRNAYRRWYVTQGGSVPEEDRDFVVGGWLIGVDELHSRRAPGNTCTSAMRAGGNGTVSEPINDSKGCGGVMRAAPAGFPRCSDKERFEMGCDFAALTHGHPDGYLPAGYLAVAVGALVDGLSMGRALDAADEQLAAADRNASTLRAVRAARELGARGLPSPEQLEGLGGGWVGDEALAIAVACAVGTTDFREGVLAAVNHSGDSDSTGSIVGNLLGAQGGLPVLPLDWLADLELRAVIEQVARDAALELRGTAPSGVSGDATPGWFARYPGV